MKIFFLFACFVIALSGDAQNNKQTPCSSPEASQFDFWLGDWDLTWSDSLHGTNHVEKIMDGCTVQENFNDPGIGYSGKSWSVYNRNYKMWQQTWVDNQGGYIDLTGGMMSDSMVLTTAERVVPTTVSPTGKMINRMVFYKIKPDSFDWNWEASTDGGKTWKRDWHIHYERKK
jgi:hypothetical protein